MKTETTITHISEVFGGWNSGYAVDVDHHETAPDGTRDGFEKTRIHLDRDEIINDDGSINHAAVARAVANHFNRNVPPSTS